MDRQEKNSRIRETFAATKMRRKSQAVQVVTAKIQENKLNREQKEALRMCFIEAKWLYNHILDLSQGENGDDVFSLNYTDLGTVRHLDKDRNPVFSELKYLSSQMRQDILRGLCTNISNLAKAKKKGVEVGALKFISSYDSINLKQNNVSHRIVDSRRVRIQGIRKPLPVNGLEQLGRFPGYEISNARLLQKPSGYYIAFTVYVGAEELPKVEKDGGDLGIDMGCQTSFTLSDGRKFSFHIEESEQTKRLQRQLDRKVKYSNNWYETRRKLRRAYERDTNRRDDQAKKFCALLKRYDVVIQDEQIDEWKEEGHGEKVQHGILGRVKSRLIDDGATVLSKWVPTTKFCPECGHKASLSLHERKFVCPHCGATEDRDVLAAKNMIWFKKNIVGAEHTEYKPVEFEKALCASSLWSLKRRSAPSSTSRSLTNVRSSRKPRNLQFHGSSLA